MNTLFQHIGTSYSSSYISDWGDQHKRLNNWTVIIGGLFFGSKRSGQKKKKEMPLKQSSVPCTRRLVKQHQKRQENIRNESSEDGQVGRVNNRQRTVRGAERTLERNRPSKLQTKQCKTSKQRERTRQHMHEWYEVFKVAKTAEQRERRLERMRARDHRRRPSETPEEHDRRLEIERLRKKRVEERMARLFRNVKKSKRVGVTVEPTIVFIKKEHIVYDPESSASQCFVIKSDKKDNVDAIPAESAVFIKQEPIEFDPQPSTSADIAIKDELAVSNEEHTQSFADVPPLYLHLNPPLS
ncbi:hypothetical protein CEXT_572671 [Caerostris extrusa]|uniref:Uncharacterized protein n=1 Tax=Caerostris extrusa TaxID=172846 RepID=A0AAV4Y619_CAEEX|nr:hypothetical protein CEXT_572671 [Caerostris extrusa]